MSFLSLALNSIVAIVRSMAKKVLNLFVLAGIIILANSAAASAAPRTAAPTGNDISWPQCGKRYPTGQAFGIVGVNGGKTTNHNPCLADQLLWAAKSSGTVAFQDKVQVYVNTANPGEVLEQYSVTTWPTDNVDPRGRTSLNNENTLLNNPYGACIFTEGNYSGYTNDMACSWQYGWNRAVETVDKFFKPAARTAAMSDNPSSYVWWLDVETMNSWQGENDAEGTPGLADKRARNTATLEAMKSFYESEGAKKVGLYSTGYQWGRIVGGTIDITTTSTGYNLKGLDSWLAGAASLSDAQKRCNNPNFPALTAGGTVTLNQYISKNLDYDYSCV